EWRGEENLNFWLDVVTHENLFESWREYQNFVKKTREKRRQSENVIDSKGIRKGNDDSGDTGVEGDDEDEDYDQEEIVDWDPSHGYRNSSSSAEDTVAPSVAHSVAHSSVDSRNPVVNHSNNSRYAGALFNGSGKNSHEIIISEDQNYKQPRIVKRVGEEDLAKS